MIKEDEEIIRKTSKAKNVGQRRILLALIVTFLLSVACLGVGGGLSYLALRGTAEDGTLLAQQIAKACQMPETASPDLAQFCPSADKVVQDAPAEVKKDPIPGPPGPTGPSGSTGESGAPGPAPTDAQVLIALKSFCTSTGKCRGRDGLDATPAQVAIAISSYCDARGQCKGLDGKAGVNGTNGKDAPPITQAQLISAFESFCSQNDNCRGPKGEPGTDGADSQVAGPPGVVGFSDDCGPAPDGQVIADVSGSYDAANQTVVISCSYKDDESGLNLQNGSP